MYDNVRLYFDEPQHKYTDTLGNKYISTTTILHEYAPKFDRDYWLKKKAKELHISEKRLAQQWQDITDEACARGTKTHNGLEDGIRGASMFYEAVKHIPRKDNSMTTVADIETIDQYIKPINLDDFIKATNNKYPDVYKVFDYYIGRGWKTNRGGLKFESGYYKKDKTTRPAQTTNVWVKKNETLLPPLTNLPNCNGSIYNMQLSIYAFLVETILGIPCVGCWLCHIDSDFVLNDYGMPKRFSDGLYHVKKNPVEKTTLYKMKYLKDEVIKIFEDRRKEIAAKRIRSKSLFDEVV